MIAQLSHVGCSNVRTIAYEVVFYVSLIKKYHLAVPFYIIQCAKVCTERELEAKESRRELPRAMASERPRKNGYNRTRRRASAQGDRGHDRERHRTRSDGRTRSRNGSSRDRADASLERTSKDIPVRSRAKRTRGEDRTSHERHAPSFLEDLDYDRETTSYPRRTRERASSESSHERSSQRPERARKDRPSASSRPARRHESEEKIPPSHQRSRSRTGTTRTASASRPRHTTSDAARHRKNNFLRNCVIGVLCVAVIGCGYAFARPGGSPQDNAQTQEAEQGQETSFTDTNGQDASVQNASEQAIVSTYTPTVASIAQVPAATTLTTYDLSDNPQTFELSEASTTTINNALAPFIENDIKLGFVVLDINTGRGISYNPDQEVYGASTIKGPFSTYICQDLVENGEIKLTDSCANFDENLKAKGTATVKNQISNAITWSSNGAFVGLRKTFRGTDYANWLSSLGVDPAIHEKNNWFAWYTPRDAAKLWMNTYLYLDEETETSLWLKSLMSKTNRSPLREGVAISENVEIAPDESSYVLVEYADATSENESEIVYAEDAQNGKQIAVEIADGEKSGQTETNQESSENNNASGQEAATTETNDGAELKVKSSEQISFVNKAGWCTDTSNDKLDYNSLSDNGVITINDTDCLFCIMTAARDNERNNMRVQTLISALFNACKELNAPLTA